MDFGPHLRLGEGMDDATHAELVSRLFVLLTMKLEDGASHAVRGQGLGKDPQVMGGLANQLQSLGEEIALVAEAARALVRTRD